MFNRVTKMTGTVLKSEIIVAGTGPAGMVAALLLEKSGFDVILAGPAVNLEDARTTALMRPALETFESLGIDTSFDGAAAPLKTLRIVDATTRLVRSAPATFQASEIGEEVFGMNIPNTALNRTLQEAVATAASIRRIENVVETWEPEADVIVARLRGGVTVEARLAVAADGRNSLARAAAGLTISKRDHRQSAFVTTFSHDRDHGCVSTEFHTETGPFTIVPLPGKRSSLVWVIRPHEAKELLTLDAPALSRRIEDRMQSTLGKIRVDGSCQVYPLATGLPSAFAARRIALVGEAAHVFPPIGAQGLNLGIRDVVDLVGVAGSHRNDPGYTMALRAYDRVRRLDVVVRSGAVTILNNSLLSDFLPAQLLRSAGLGLLSSIPPLRSWFMREGMRPGSGFAAIASAFRKQVGR